MMDHVQSDYDLVNGPLHPKPRPSGQRTFSRFCRDRPNSSSSSSKYSTLTTEKKLEYLKAGKCFECGETGHRFYE